MTTKTIEALIKRRAEEQWQAFVEDKACCTEHAVKYSFTAGATDPTIRKAIELETRANVLREVADWQGTPYSIQRVLFHDADNLGAALAELLKTGIENRTSSGTNLADSDQAVTDQVR
jgi:hypothetical protein